jgi:PAS domain S-box-containing protein
MSPGHQETQPPDERVEAALRASKERFQTLTDALPQLIWTNDADGRADYFNQRWYEYSGLNYEQSAGEGWQEVVHRDDAPASVERWRQTLAAGEVFEAEYRLRRADGVHRWHLGRNVPLRNEQGQVTGWFGTATDIEGIKQTQAALRQSEERFRLLVEGTRDYAMFLLDTDNRISFWSAGAERVFGWSEAEAIGQDGSLIFTPEDRATDGIRQEFLTALTTGSAVDRRWHARKNGERLFLDGTLTRLENEHGRLRGFVKIARDATAQRLAEEALERANVELEGRVARRTAALAASNQGRQLLLRQLVTAQEEERLRIARDLHDQLGQQITGMQLGLKQLEQETEGTSVAKMLPALQALALQMAIDTHRFATDLRPTALDDIGLVPTLQRLVEGWSAQTQVPAAFQSYGLDQYQLAPEVATTLYRVVQEALTNIQKYAHPTVVSVVLERRIDELLVIIEDNGRGFDVEALAARGAHGQLGILGMRERVALLGGTLELESSPNNGTTIFVRVPLAEPTEL